MHPPIWAFTRGARLAVSTFVWPSGQTNACIVWGVCMLFLAIIPALCAYQHYLARLSGFWHCVIYIFFHFYYHLVLRIYKSRVGRDNEVTVKNVSRVIYLPPPDRLTVSLVSSWWLTSKPKPLEAVGVHCTCCRFEQKKKPDVVTDILVLLDDELKSRDATVHTLMDSWTS